MKSPEYPEEFPRKFQGNTKLGFLGISSDYTDGIPRKYQSVGIFRRNSEEKWMAAQQAGYEAQRRLNQQMMEMMQRMYPNEVFPDVPDP
ncbi:hypothetical protein F2Q69_00011578 [Brassica cretica]|uniref:Uncharacterized protein n=1 Tax=Brassica cretica TaxID=69181 RepID=A0A8S9QZ91_BRACR|nr:hypothetical protein F2Q69_00011578 [Brassica cretica]